MNLIFLGPPGVGKGTQANLVCGHFGILHLSTGDMLRSEINKKSGIGTKAKTFIDQGDLVPDEVLLKIINSRLSDSDIVSGYLLDGFPRTINQANALKLENIEIDYCVEVKVPDDEIVERMSGRRVHLSSGRTYHIKFNPPIETNKDDITGGELIQRVDDNEEIVRSRLSIYHKQTEPLVQYYRNDAENSETSAKFIALDGVGTLEEVKDRISNALTS